MGEPLVSRLIADVNLGKLAQIIALTSDPVIVATAVADKRIIVTRDRRLLFAKQIEHGYWVRSTEAKQQTLEVLHQFELKPAIQPFTRCLLCNGSPLVRVPKANILEQLEPKTKQYYEIGRAHV